jgi:hypothetical protein
VRGWLFPNQECPCIPEVLLAIPNQDAMNKLSLILFLFVSLFVSNVAFSGTPNSRTPLSVTLESRLNGSSVELVLHDQQAGTYHHFILERSLDGKFFSEVARSGERTVAEGAQDIVFKDFPFDRNSLPTVFYRIRAVDELGWFDFTNVVSVSRREQVASKENQASAGGQF